MPEKREAGVAAPASRTANYFRNHNLAAPVQGPRTEGEQLELDALLADHKADWERRHQDEDTGKWTFYYPPPPWQEVTRYYVHCADFEEVEREGRPWTIDLDALCDRLDADYRLCVAPHCEELSKRRYCVEHEQKLRHLMARLGREEQRGSVPEMESVPDEFASDCYRQPETISNAKRGPRPKGLRGEALRRELRGLPFTLEELRDAILARAFRTAEQKLIVAVFQIWVADRQPNADELAELVGCGSRTIDIYETEGEDVLEQLEQRLAEKIEQESDRVLVELLAALGIDPVAEAEQIIEEAA